MLSPKPAVYETGPPETSADDPPRTRSSAGPERQCRCLCSGWRAVEKVAPLRNICGREDVSHGFSLEGPLVGLGDIAKILSRLFF